MANVIFTSLVFIANIWMLWYFITSVYKNFKKSLANRNGAFIPKYVVGSVPESLPVIGVIMLLAVSVPEGAVFWSVLASMAVLESWRIYAALYLEGIRYYIYYSAVTLGYWLIAFVYSIITTGLSWVG